MGIADARFKDVLPEQHVRAIVAYLKAFGARDRLPRAVTYGPRLPGTQLIAARRWKDAQSAVLLSLSKLITSFVQCCACTQG